MLKIASKVVQNGSKWLNMAQNGPPSGMEHSIDPNSVAVYSIRRQAAKVGVRIPSGPFRTVLPGD
eukprot:2849850-Prymnesium_polylepis.1